MRAKFFTRTAGGFDIFTAALRVTNKIAARVAAHKRHIQRPAGEANEGYPRQLLFKEVLIHRNMLAEQHAQHHDVCPAVVVADQQIPVLFVQAFQTTGRPILARIEMQQQRQPFAPAVHHKIAKNGYRAPYRWNGDQQFNQPGDDDRYRADNGD